MRHIFSPFFIFPYNCARDTISPSRRDRQLLIALANGFCHDIKIGEARKKPRCTTVRVLYNVRSKTDEGPQAEIPRYDCEVDYVVASRAVHFNDRRMTGETAAEANGNRGYADVHSLYR